MFIWPIWLKGQRLETSILKPEITKGTGQHVHLGRRFTIVTNLGCWDEKDNQEIKITSEQEAELRAVNIASLIHKYLTTTD